MNKTQKDVHQTPQWALDRIKEARDKRLTRLSLQKPYRSQPVPISEPPPPKEVLTTIPREVIELNWLESLDLSANELTTVSETIGHLSELQSLNLRGNQIQTLFGIGKLSKLQTLDLSNNQLKTVPDTIFQLAELKSLKLSFNQIVSIPDTVSQINKLETLDLYGNQLKAIPDTIGKLTNLHQLYLSCNQLNAIPNTISHLSELKTLTLYDNQLAAFPDAIAQLTNLTELDLRDNQIATIPNVIARLVNLQMLWLSNNHLKIVPHWLVELPKLKILNLFDNPIETPPPEVLKLKTLNSVNLKELNTYFRQQSEEGEEALYEAKLLIVGEPGAGKTSLTRKLIHPFALLPAKDESTEGIDVHTWTFPLPSQGSFVFNRLIDPNPEFRVNIWDFGGQAIYHATHQFFLTRRSLYIVVADAREQKTDFFHWLDLIEHLSDRSPVFIFNNEIQDRHWALNEQQLQDLFPETFQQPFAFNLAHDETGLTYLRQKIQEQITTLPHVGNVLPRTWVNVRRALEKDSRPTVNLQEFFQLCRNNGFVRTDDILQLSGYLHDLGVILHFQDDLLLKHTVILQPEWGTDAVYRVLDNDEVKASQGHFSRADLSRIWHEDEYTLLHDELLALMMKFQLCYAIPRQTDHYIAPQLLGEQPPDYEWSSENNLHLRYKYEAFMPKGILTRLIVVMHPHIATDDEQLVWRTGVVLEKDNTHAEVVEFYHRREIRIRVVGKYKRDLLTIITYELDKLHKPFHRLKFDKLIPCNCPTCQAADEPYFYRLDILKTRLEHGKEVIECDKPPFETVQIRPLLDDVGATYPTEDLPALLRQLESVFNDEELKTVCFELGIEYGDLPAANRSGKMRELITYCQRHGRLDDLVELLQQKRPGLN